MLLLVVLMRMMMMMMIAMVTVFALAGNEKSMKVIDSPVRQITSVRHLVVSESFIHATFNQSSAPHSR